ncbi:unnamed protein product [Camellia sinensis]
MLVNLVLILHTIAVHVVLIFMLVVLYCLRVKIVMIMNTCLLSSILSQKEEQESIFIYDVVTVLLPRTVGSIIVRSAIMEPIWMV